MVEWQYATLTAKDMYVGGKWSHREITFNGPDGTTKSTRASAALPKLNELGRDGWEVFHIETLNHVYSNQIGDWVYPTAQPVERTYWFKRLVNRGSSHGE